jgi:hypothetical protein
VRSRNATTPQQGRDGKRSRHPKGGTTGPLPKAHGTHAVCRWWVLMMILTAMMVMMTPSWPAQESALCCPPRVRRADHQPPTASHRPPTTSPLVSRDEMRFSCFSAAAAAAAAAAVVAVRRCLWWCRPCCCLRACVRGGADTAGRPPDTRWFGLASWSGFSSLSDRHLTYQAPFSNQASSNDFWL